MKIDTYHARLIMLKNTAYAWRQMIFFLSLMPDVGEFFGWAETHLQQQSGEFRNRFRPVLNGLRSAATGRAFDPPFLGWSDGAKR